MPSLAVHPEEPAACWQDSANPFREYKPTTLKLPALIKNGHQMNIMYNSILVVILRDIQIIEYKNSWRIYNSHL